MSIPVIGSCPAISVLQPRATFLALGVCRIETRTWETKHRGWTAIAASTGDLKETRERCESEPYLSVLRLCDIEATGCLPRGEIVGIAYLRDCVQIDRRFLAQHGAWVSGKETQLSNFAAGRWAWLFEQPWIARRGLKAKSEPGMFRFKAPEGLWLRAPWWVTCANPDCREKSKTRVGVRARCWDGGYCPRCYEEMGNRALPEHAYALPPARVAAGGLDLLGEDDQ